MVKKSIAYLVLSLFLVGVFYVVLTLSQGRTNFFGKATAPGTFVLENSRVFGSPLISKANGSDKIRITVFVLNGEGKGVSGKSVAVGCKDPVVCQNANVAFTPVQPSTDNLGQAIIDVSSQVPGKYELQASVTGLAVPQTVKVVFQ